MILLEFSETEKNVTNFLNYQTIFFTVIVLTHSKNFFERLTKFSINS